jgi:hypothetical protein
MGILLQLVVELVTEFITGRRWGRCVRTMADVIVVGAAIMSAILLVALSLMMVLGSGKNAFCLLVQLQG